MSEIAAHHGFAMEELEVDNDQVHLFLSVPPRYSIKAVRRRLKAVSAKEIRDECPEVRKQLWGGEFWEEGYVVRTVREKVTAEVIKTYIRFHEEKKRRVDQLDLFEKACAWQGGVLYSKWARPSPRSQAIE
ncbi:MAG TPA: IS200/IS605 family transposase [Nitrospira sp.]|nr:IS200/IS605 family transposase [Nitrospira sp.]